MGHVCTSPKRFYEQGGSLGFELSRFRIIISIVFIMRQFFSLHFHFCSSLEVHAMPFLFKLNFDCLNPLL